jgi:hypothetical protein
MPSPRRTCPEREEVIPHASYACTQRSVDNGVQHSLSQSETGDGKQIYQHLSNFHQESTRITVSCRPGGVQNYRSVSPADILLLDVIPLDQYRKKQPRRRKNSVQGTGAYAGMSEFKQSWVFFVLVVCSEI